MFVDIVDSTLLPWERGDEPFRTLASRLDRRLRRTIAHQDGAAVDGITVGDGLPAEFASPAAALDCAVDCIDVSTEIGSSLHDGLNTGAWSAIGTTSSGRR
jgi:class 3 adenylate cyclase